MGKFKWGPASLERRETLHPDLQKVVDLALELSEEDLSILCGYRGLEAQEKALAEGNSKAKFGQSYHNFYPSLAVDIVPYPIDWDNHARFAKMAAVVQTAAKQLGIRIRWGGNFKSIHDEPHFEMII